MTVDFPFEQPGFCGAQWQWGAQPKTLAVASAINGGIQTQGTPWKRWVVTMVLPPTTSVAVQAAREAFLDSLNGQEVRVRLWHFARVGRTGRGSPMGTINTSGVQVNAIAAQFATAIQLKGCGNAKTLQAGDMFKVGNQLIMAPPSGGLADAGGLMTVAVTGGLIASVAVNDAVTLIKPMADFILTTPDWRAVYNPGVGESLSLDWIEAR